MNVSVLYAYFILIHISYSYFMLLIHIFATVSNEVCAHVYLKVSIFCYEEYIGTDEGLL